MQTTLQVDKQEQLPEIKEESKQIENVIPVQSDNSTETLINRDNIRKLSRIVHACLKNDDSVEFRTPVFYKALGLLDYRKIVKKPMDLNKVNRLLTANKYKYIEEFLEDIQLIWDNCRLYNKPDSWIYKQADQMEAFFKEQILIYIPGIPPPKANLDKLIKEGQEQLKKEEEQRHSKLSKSKNSNEIKEFNEEMSSSVQLQYKKQSVSKSSYQQQNDYNDGNEDQSDENQDDNVNQIQYQQQSLILKKKIAKKKNAKPKSKKVNSFSKSQIQLSNSKMAKPKYGIDIEKSLNSSDSEFNEVQVNQDLQANFDQFQSNRYKENLGNNGSKIRQLNKKENIGGSYKQAKQSISKKSKKNDAKQSIIKKHGESEEQNLLLQNSDEKNRLAGQKLNLKNYLNNLKDFSKHLQFNQDKSQIILILNQIILEQPEIVKEQPEGYYQVSLQKLNEDLFNKIKAFTDYKELVHTTTQSQHLPSYSKTPEKNHQLQQQQEQIQQNVNNSIIINEDTCKPENSCQITEQSTIQQNKQPALEVEQTQLPLEQSKTDNEIKASNI